MIDVMWAELLQDGDQDGTVVTAICYKLGGLGYEPWWGKIFRTHPDSCTMCTGSISPG